jgi:hypothetical protein
VEYEGRYIVPREGMDMFAATTLGLGCHLTALGHS